MADEEAIRRKHNLLATAMHDLCLPKTPHAPKRLEFYESLP